ncbi:hypothetical protein UQW22_04915 [Isoptericola halotolerans]|uniref:hypothetical protein n=1 Tax=Isoptericola halotolerans TaxID=300560 RepID=UPI00388E9C1A
MSMTTTDHQEIRSWVEAHDGVPGLIDASGLGDARPVPAVVFPQDDSTSGPRPVGWDEWFEVFDASGLAFRHTAGGPQDSPPVYELLNPST